MCIKKHLDKLITPVFVTGILATFIISLVQVFSGNTNWLNTLVFTSVVLFLYVVQQSYHFKLPNINKKAIKSNLNRIKKNAAEITSLGGLATGNANKIMELEKRIKTLESLLEISNKE